MKKLLTAIIIATSCANANAMSSIRHIPMQPHNNSYQIGYHTGKQHAYNNVGRTVAIVGTAIVVGIFIYELGKESRWTVNENGIGYRF
jgi:hypothetical protein